MGYAGNAFDNLKYTMTDTVTAVHGYSATWTPAAGGDMQSAAVLFRAPTDKQKEGDIEYAPYSYIMEYKAVEFVGLKASVDSNVNNEYVFITEGANTTRYYVKQCNLKSDGGIVEAILAIPADDTQPQ